MARKPESHPERCKTISLPKAAKRCVYSYGSPSTMTLGVKDIMISLEILRY